MKHETNKHDSINNNNFIINLQYLKDISFENPLSPGIFFQKYKDQPQIKVNIDVTVNKITNENYEIVLGINVSSTHEEKNIYILEIKYAAISSINQSLDEEQKKKTLMVEIPKFLLPYVRYFVADIIRESGFTQLMIDPINFETLYEQHEKKESK